MKNYILFSLSALSIMLFVGCELIEDYWGNNDNSNENWKFAYMENYVDSLDAVLSPDGYVCLFGVDTSDEIDGEYNKIFYITKADYKTGEITSADEICVVVDSVGIPNIISMENYNIYISNITNSTFDCIIVEEGKENIELKNLSLPKQESYSIKGATKSIASSDAIPIYGLDNLIDDIGKAQAMQAMITAATNTEKWSAGIGAIGTILGGEAGLTLGGISDALTGSLRNSYIAIAGYMWSENQKFILNHIGPWHISIESVKQTERNSCVVGYTINGIWDDCDGKPRVFLNCQNSDKDKHTGKVEQTLELGYAVNGYHEVKINNLKAGYYLIEMKLYDECHKATNMSIRTYPSILLNMLDLELSKYEIGDNPLYKNGAVNFKMDIFLKGNEDGLKDIQQFGYYIKYANVIDYRKVDYLSSIFESTPLTYDLSIPRDGFSDETINYTTFEAKPSIDYFIGVYTENDGKLQTYDEQKLELIYNEQPEIETGEYVPVSPTTVNVEGEFKNCLFWNAIRGIEYVAESESNPKSIVLGANEEDGEHQFPLENLKPNTTYQYRAYYEVNGIREYGEPMEFKTEPLNLTLDSYEIEENPLCSLDGNVSFKMRINILGDNNIFTYARECGYYIRTANRINYYQIKKFSSIFSSTQINHNLIINKDKFNIIDYSSFRAEATEYKIGVYVVEKSNNNILLLCEKDLMGLIYNERPAIIFSNAFVTESKYDGSREIDDITYTFTRFWTSATVHAEGVLFIDLENLIYHEKSGDRDEDTRKFSLSLGTTSGWGQGSLWIGTRDMPGEYSGMFRYNNHGAGVCFCCGWPGGHTGASYWGDHAPKGQSLFPNTEYISFYVNGKEMRSNTITTTPDNVSCN